MPEAQIRQTAAYSVIAYVTSHLLPETVLASAFAARVMHRVENMPVNRHALDLGIETDIEITRSSVFSRACKAPLKEPEFRGRF